jgi:phenylacetic acid degradation operon negative regulatory protein
MRGAEEPRGVETQAVSAVLATERPYTARSVLASTLLGSEPPALPARLLVRVGELFDISEGTARVAISRMTSAGELVADDGTYRLAGHLLERQARQAVARHALTNPWSGSWRVEVVSVGAPRSAAERAELRVAMAALRLAEWREGVWLRPDNLPRDATGTPDAVVRGQCQRLDARPEDPADELASQLWDLAGWAGRARTLGRALAELQGRLERRDTSALPAGFVVSAAVLRHFLADPLLPAELLTAEWPGLDLRDAYERYDRAFKETWRQAFHQSR